MALRDLLQSIQAAMAMAMPAPGYSAVAHVGPGSGVVTPSGTPCGTFSPVLKVTQGGAPGTAKGQLSLDGGINFAPEFTLVAPAATYDVPLDPAPAQSGMQLAFSGTFNQGDTYSWSASCAPYFFMGEEWLESQGVFPRVVWVPVTTDWVGTEDYAGTQNQVNAPRALAMGSHRIEAHCWGADYQRTELLRDQVINGLASGAPSPMRLVSGEWQRGKDEFNRAGRGYTLTFQVKAPVLELQPGYVVAPPPFTEQLTEEIDMPDGTSQASTT
jgi:hypothetical protein